MVCGKTTSHAEVVLVEFDPKKVSYERLLETFFDTHNPCQRGGQGLNRGDQYRSAIYFFGEDQEEAARRVCDRLQNGKYRDRPITTEIAAAGPFWMAEDYHQQYYEKHGMVGGCRIR